jgi:hypothetical protein
MKLQTALLYMALWLLTAHLLLIPYCTCLRRRRKYRYPAAGHTTEGVWQILSAHRGGAFERVENSLGAFKNAISQGMNSL